MLPLFKTAFRPALRPALGLQMLPRHSRFLSASRFVLQEASKKTTQKKPKVNYFDKIRRGTTFLFSTGLVVGALGLASVTIYLLIAELFFPSGDTQTYNRLVAMVQKDEKACQLLNNPVGQRLKAYGSDQFSDRWTRNRPITSSRKIGKDGKEHLYMKLTVESDSGKRGHVVMEAVDESIYKQDYLYVYLDVPGEKRYYLVSPKTYGASTGSHFRFLGIDWGSPKK